MAPASESVLQPSDADLAAALDRRFRRPLMKFFLRRVGKLAEAEDLTQEVFARALKAGPVAALNRPDSFLFTVATNLLRDRHRAVLRHRAVMEPASEAADAAGSFAGPVEDRDPERVLQGCESLSEALKCLDALPERTRDMFILFRLEQMKQKEIAALYGVTVKAVEKHILRAVTHLARTFGSERS